MKKLLGLLTLSVLILAGCGSGSNEDTIKIGFALFTDPTEQQVIVEDIIPKLEEETGLTIDAEFIAGGDIVTKMVTEAEAEMSTYDVVFIHDGSIATLLDADLLTELPEKDIEFIESVDTAYVIDDTRYMYPFAADTYLGIANNDSLEYLPEGTTLETLSWEQFAEWGANIKTATDSSKMIFPASPVSAIQYQLGAISLSYGGEFPSINDAGWQEAWAIFNDMVASEAIHSDASKTNENPTTSIKSGETWISVYHMTAASDIYQSNPEQYSVFAAPEGPNGRGSIAGSFGVGIPTYSENKENAQTTIDWFLETENSVYMLSNAGTFIPPTNLESGALDETNPTQYVQLQGVATLNTGVLSGVNASYYTDFNAVKGVYDSIVTEIFNANGLSEAELIELLDVKQLELEALEK